MRVLIHRLRELVKRHPKLYAIAARIRKAVSPTRSDQLAGIPATGAASLEKILRRLEQECDHPVVVKVGANDGLAEDPCGDHFLKTVKWKGLLIEPVPHYVKRLEEIYWDRARFAVAPCAIGRRSGAAPFYCVADEAKVEFPDLPIWYDQVGSFDREHIVRQLGVVIEPYLMEMQVPVNTLMEVLAQHKITDISFLQIDTEGFDLVVLQGLDFGRLRPGSIFVEHKHLSAADLRRMILLLGREGYQLSNTGYDFLAIRT